MLLSLLHQHVLALRSTRGQRSPWKSILNWYDKVTVSGGELMVVRSDSLTTFAVAHGRDGTPVCMLIAITHVSVFVQASEDVRVVKLENAPAQPAPTPSPLEPPQIFKKVKRRA